MELEVVCLRVRASFCAALACAKYDGGNGLRCGARAVVGTLLRAYLLAFCEATTESTLAKRVHVVTLFLLTSLRILPEILPGRPLFDMTGIWARYQNRRDPVSLARDPSRTGGPLALLDRVSCEAKTAGTHGFGLPPCLPERSR